MELLDIFLRQVYDTLKYFIYIFTIRQTHINERMTATEVKNQIRQMSQYDKNKLSELSQKSGIPLMTVNFWYNAIKN